MKSLPKGEVMLGGELTDKMQVSFIMRSLLSFIMKFAMSLNPFLHFSFGEDPQSDGRYEFPHLTFPLFRVMDRVVVTAPGEELPELGKELPETESDRVLRRNGKGVNCFKEGFTYSFSFHSMYVDFSRWIICNFPGYRAIDLTGFLGQQKVKVVCYELVDPNGKSSSEEKPPPAYHYNNFKRYLMYMEMTHTSIMSPEDLANAEETRMDDEEEVDPTVTGQGLLTEDTNQNRSDVEDDGSESGSDDDFDLQRSNTIDHLDQQDADVEAEDATNSDKEDDVGSLKPGSEYVLANTVVSLLSTQLPTDPNATEANESDHEDCDECLDSHYGIADSAGTAVRKECHDIPIVRFIRAPIAVPVTTTTQPNLTALRNPLSSLRRSIAVAAQSGMSRGYRASSSHQMTSEDSISLGGTRSLEEIETNNVLTAGDEIMIQCASTGKYLTVHRGWWVNWTSHEIGLKSVFSLEILSSSGVSYAPHGTKLVSGVPFRLKSVKWPQWEVGCYDRPVHGRQLVVLFQSLNNPNRSAPSGPIKWGKNGQMVYPLSISVMSDTSMSYPMMNTSESKAVGRDSEEITPVSFFDFQISPEETAETFDLKVDIVGSADVFNRKLHQAQLAYIIRVSYSTAPESPRVQWTTLRTQEDMDVILNQIPGAQETNSSQDPQNGKRRRSYYSSISGPWTNSTNSPRFSSPIKLEQLKRATSFATVSARHQCSADQSVYLMSKQIQTIFDREMASASSPSPPPMTGLTGGTITTPPSNNGRSHSTSTNDPLESPRLSSENGELANEFTLPPAVLPPLGTGTSPKASSLLASMTTTPASDHRGDESINQSQTHNGDVKSILLKALSKPELLDTLFLHDSDPEKYLPVIRREPTRVSSILVARALWDTHWREEIAILYASYIACYPLLGSKPAWVLSLQEIIGVSYLPEDISPLPRFCVMRIETIGRIHYLAFISKDYAQAFAAKMEGNITNVSFDSPIPSFVELTDPRDRFVVKSGRWRPAGRRLVLNARKFTFDIEKEHSSLSAEPYWMYSARLLKTVFQLDSNNSIRINSESIKRSSKDGKNSSADVFEAATDQLFPGKSVFISPSLSFQLCSLCLSH
jgi:hypothetical protein